jgi:hypothetical protein
MFVSNYKPMILFLFLLLILLCVGGEYVSKA